MFDPTLGRFLQRDPRDDGPRDDNLYRYVGDSPANGTDRLGLAKDQAKLTVEDILANLKKCDGGTNVLANATKAAKDNIDKAPTIELGKLKDGSEAGTNLATGVITIDKDSDLCKATESLVFELGNLSQLEKFGDLIDEGLKGNLSREKFIMDSERLEYNSLVLTLKAIDACKEKWGCKEHKFCLYEFRNPETKEALPFEKVYQQLKKEHKERYGATWDKNFKTPYEEAQKKKGK
jgi:hypothetical protein